jgi:diguanylate cyclase
VYHDPHIPRAARDAENPGFIRRFGRAIGLVEEAAAPEEQEPERRGETIDPEGPGIEQLSCMLAELISAAQERVDGAAQLVGRSAEEASTYRSALADGARMLDASDLPVTVASALIDVTRTMIERTRGAEARLRDMGDELATLQQDLAEARECAERDPLTGLPNRRALESALTKAVATARAAEAALSLAYCDIDHFKQLNDVHGHAVGDRVLRHVADCLADGVGPGVMVSRFGGEEFVMILDGVGVNEASVRVDEIRERLASKTLRSRSNDNPIGTVTFSAGIAALRSNETPDDLLDRADKALYRAKHAGRNRVEVDRSR